MRPRPKTMVVSVAKQEALKKQCRLHLVCICLTAFHPPPDTLRAAPLAPIPLLCSAAALYETLENIPKEHGVTYKQAVASQMSPGTH